MISPVGGMEANNVQSALQPLFAAFDQTRLATQISGDYLSFLTGSSWLVTDIHLERCCVDHRGV